MNQELVAFLALPTRLRIIQVECFKTKKGAALERGAGTVNAWLKPLRLMEKLFFELFRGHRAERQLVLTAIDLDLAFLRYMALDQRL